MLSYDPNEFTFDPSKSFDKTALIYGKIEKVMDACEYEKMMLFMILVNMNLEG